MTLSITTDTIYVDNIVVAKNDIYYSLYNTVTGAIYSDKYLYISDIMNGKVIAFKENVGYFIINLKDSGLPESPIYNFDVQSLNLAMSSAGFYFTYNNGKYAYVGLDGKTYINVQSYSYKVIDNKIRFILPIEKGKVLITSDIDVKGLKR